MDFMKVGSKASQAAFVGKSAVNGPGHVKMSDRPARWIKLVERVNSGYWLAISRTLGVQLLCPIVLLPKVKVLQNLGPEVT